MDIFCAETKAPFILIGLGGGGGGGGNLCAKLPAFSTKPIKGMDLLWRA